MEARRIFLRVIPNAGDVNSRDVNEGPGFCDRQTCRRHVMNLRRHFVNVHHVRARQINGVRRGIRQPVVEANQQGDHHGEAHHGVVRAHNGLNPQAGHGQRVERVVRHHQERRVQEVDRQERHHGGQHGILRAHFARVHQNLQEQGVEMQERHRHRQGVRRRGRRVPNHQPDPPAAFIDGQGICNLCGFMFANLRQHYQRRHQRRN